MLPDISYGILPVCLNALTTQVRSFNVCSFYACTRLSRDPTGGAGTAFEPAGCSTDIGTLQAGRSSRVKG